MRGGTTVSALLLLGVMVINLATPSEGQGGGGGGRRRRPQQSARPSKPAQGGQNQRQSELPGCNCLAKADCPPNFGQLGTQCLLENGSPGICCIPQEGVVLNRVGFTSAGVQPTQLSSNEINDGYKSGQQILTRLKAEQQTLKSKGEYLKRRSPSRSHAFFFQRNPSAKRIHDLAYTIAQSSVAIAGKESLSPKQSFFGLPNFQVGSPQGLQCPLEQVPNCDSNSKYRTIDGSCNNLRNPLFGKSETGFSRISPPLYEDGIMEPRTLGVDGRPLPNVREASNTVLIDIDQPDPQHTLNVMQWAQFLDHDLTLTPFPDMDGEAIRCCENGQRVNPQPMHCFPIDIKPDDGFYGARNQGCINFVRSMLALRPGCALGPVEQLNGLTHWLDGSMVYGSTPGDKNRVTDLSTGLLLVSANNLPPVNGSVDCDSRVPNTCFVAGDSRINEQPGLTALHTILIREHNRIANILKQKNPSLSPDALYEETRRIVVAEIQHITYTEWLPIIIGPTVIRELNLKSGYNPSIDPAISSEFATAAFRFGHSLIQGIYKLVSEAGRISTVRLRDVFNAPNLFPENPKLLDSYVRALTMQSIQTLDSFISQDVTNHLFQTSSFDFGMDLMSLNLQRGRDHAISTYNQMRVKFRLPNANSFLDLVGTTSPDIVRRMQTVYKNVDDIDLFMGGITETPLKDAILGPLFARIVGQQFQKIMNADRFFYDLQGQPGSFTPAQLSQLKKASMARLFCDNSGVGQMQPLAFKLPSAQNPRLPCDSPQIPSVDLSVF